MPRPRLKEEEKKQLVTITLDKTIYKNLRKKGVNISGTINRLLKVAYCSNAESNNVWQPEVMGSNPIRPISLLLSVSSMALIYFKERS